MAGTDRSLSNILETRGQYSKNMDQDRVTVKSDSRTTVDDRIDKLSTALLYKAANRVLKEVKDSLKEARGGSLANSDLAASLGMSKVNKTYTGWQINVGSGVAHAVFVEKGRKAGTRPPLDKIQEWLDSSAKPVPPGMTKQTYARAIANKIGKSGIPPLRFFEKAINKIKSSSPK